MMQKMIEKYRNYSYNDNGFYIQYYIIFKSFLQVPISRHPWMRLNVDRGEDV
jgi:hypothetical protein